MDDRARFESEELRQLAVERGATPVYVNGILCWQFPPWICPFCSKIAGPEAEVQSGCPEPLARHGKIKR